MRLFRTQWFTFTALESRWIHMRAITGQENNKRFEDKRNTL